jgi:pSer/pThr/pTyr-binding forkhead associated (FHA) protein
MTLQHEPWEDHVKPMRGSGMLVIKRGPNAGSRFRLDQSVTSAGRHPVSDILLDDITVSPSHAEFLRENDQFQVVELGSLNNIYLNGKPVHSAMLAHGDEIQIGNFRLVFLTRRTSSTPSVRRGGADEFPQRSEPYYSDRRLGSDRHQRRDLARCRTRRCVCTDRAAASMRIGAG